MATIKKYNGSSWENAVVRKFTTSTDTITTLPADLYADGNNATVGLVGNMVQNGSPSPSSIIAPQECGDLETSGAKAGQYKIPISSANTTTPVYLGEVESTRQIKQLVLTGEETGWNVSTGTTVYYINDLVSDYLHEAKVICVCSHFKTQINTNSASNIESNTVCFRNSSDRLYINSPTHATTTDFTTYLQQQYANGTPVTIWYVLAEPTTGIVNEPLRKIGDYTDTVSGITIPTITGKDTFDVQTTLKPSEVSLTYTGWHGASVGEWDGSEWQ